MTRIFTRTLLLATAATLLVSATFADAESKEPAEGKTVIFVTPEDYDVARLLPPPPAADSALATAEVAELHRIEDARTPAQEEQARSDTKTKDVTIFTTVMGPGFDLKTLPATGKLFADIRNDEKIAADAAKDYFKRNRPWVVDPSLKSCSRNDDAQTSYPSGHATMGYTMGVVLASLVPEKAQEILARSAVYAENRLECGVHFRSDIVAGQVLGTVLAERMMTKPKFRAEYAAAAKELAAAHLIEKAPR